MPNMIYFNILSLPAQLGQFAAFPLYQNGWLMHIRIKTRPRDHLSKSALSFKCRLSDKRFKKSPVSA